MALRSVLDIDVNDEKFKTFIATFNKFQDQLKQMPEVWAKAGTEAKKQEVTFEAILAALLARDELDKGAVDANEKIEKHARGAEIHWRGLARNTASFAGNVRSATTALLKWAGLTTFFSGILGAGGLFGIDRLAISVATGRRSAMGLGIGYGQQQSFGLAYGRFVDPQSFLGNVSHGLFDVTSPQYKALLTAGVPQSVLGKGNAADAGVALLHQLPKLFGNVPPALRGSLLHAYGLDQVLNLGDVNRYLAASPKERAAQDEAYRKGVGQFGLSAGDQRAWQDFMTKLQSAGKEIENVLAKGLVKLSVPIGDLAHSFADAVKAFLDSPTLEKWIDSAADGLEKFARYIGTDKFKTDVQEFVKDVGQLAEAIVNALKWLGVIPDKGVGHSVAKDAGMAALGAGIGRAVAGLPGAVVGGVLGYGASRLEDDSRREIEGGTAPIDPRTGRPMLPLGGLGGGLGYGLLQPQSFLTSPRSHFRATSAVYRVPSIGKLPGEYASRVQAVSASLNASGLAPWLSRGIASGLFAESKLDPNAVNPASGAFGIAQWLGSRKAELFRRYGPHPTLQQQLAFLSWELHGGDPGGSAVLGAKTELQALEAFIRRFERPGAGAETMGDMARGERALGTLHKQKQPMPSRHPTVRVLNETGGAAVIIASQLTA